MPAFFVFTGHPKSKQNLISEGEDACVDGVGRWPRDAAKAVTDASAEFLRQTSCFHELTEDEFSRLTQAEPQPDPQPDPQSEPQPDPQPEPDAEPVAIQPTPDTEGAHE